MQFEWDPAKNAANIAKHGIDFEDAIAVFDARFLEQRDDRLDYGERWAVIGRIGERFLYVVYTWRGEKRRIISARWANEHERRA
jgi:uncharacterized DUF497 family protein